MSLGADEINRIAWLARLQIEPDAVPEYADNLNNILHLVEQMSAVDTDNIEPMAHPQDVTQRLRDDVVSEQNQRDAFQSIAPATEDGCYLVPRVIE